MGRAPCCDKDGLKKGPWLPEEDEKLVDFIREHGPGNWRSLPKKAGLQRCGKSCRLRWTNYLRPDIKRGRFTFDEEEAIIQLHSVLGNKWSAIAAKLPGRTDNEIKNYWNTHIKKRLLRTGIDPVTHTHRLDLLNLHSILNSPLQNSSHFNWLKLLGLQSLVNPNLLRLAALLSSNLNPNQNQDQDQNSNSNLFFQNDRANEILNNSTPMQNQHHQMAQTKHQSQTEFQSNDPTCATTMTTCFNDGQVMQPNLDQCRTTTTFPDFDALNFDAQTSSMVNELWQSNAPLVNADRYVPNNIQNKTNNSVLSTPCTSQGTPLNSNSEHPYSSISSTTEDEIDSYCRSFMNFDIPEEFFDIC